jgi:GT2 family glycosyltransferase
MRVGAVVLHYRFWPGIRSTLRCLIAQHRRPDEIMVVDNRSGDGSASRIRDEFAGLTVIESSHNGGYAAGMNVGIRSLLIHEMEAILLLTHDCELRSDAVEKLVERLEAQPRVAAVGPLLGFSSSREQVFSAGGTIDPITWETGQVLVPDKIDEWRGMPPHEVDWLDGAAILLRSEAVREAGPLSTAYFMYFEESEYLLRLRRRGWKVECVPAAVGWQEPKMSTYPVEFRIRNRLRFLARNAPMAVLRRELASIVLWSMKRTVRRPRRVRQIWGPRVKGIMDFALARNGPPRTTA